MAKLNCEEEGKILRSGYVMPAGCVPRPRKDLSKSKREEIAKWNQRRCNAHPDIAYWRDPKKVKATCQIPRWSNSGQYSGNRWSAAQSKLMEEWDKFVAEHIPDVCRKNDKGIIPDEQIPYCRNSANYIRKNRIARNAVGNLNTLANEVAEGKLNQKEALREYKQYLESIENKIPTISLVDAKLLMDEARRVNEARKAGRKNVKPKPLSKLRAGLNKEKMAQIEAEIRRELRL